MYYPKILRWKSVPDFGEKIDQSHSQLAELFKYDWSVFFSFELLDWFFIDFFAWTQRLVWKL